VREAAVPPDARSSPRGLTQTVRRRMVGCDLPSPLGEEAPHR
jgi:hypothetical protein